MQFLIQFLDRVHLWYGNQKVPPCVADQVLDMPLLLGASNQTEVGFIQVVALKSQELLSELPITVARDLGHGDLAVVVADPSRNPTEEIKSSFMSLLERLGTLPRERLDVEYIAVRQRHDE